MYICMYVYIYIYIYIYIYVFCCGTAGLISSLAPLGAHYRGVQWEGGAVNGGSLM